MIEDQLDKLAAEEMDEDLAELATKGLFSTTALLAIQQTRLLNSIDKAVWSMVNDGLGTYERRD